MTALARPAVWPALALAAAALAVALGARGASRAADARLRAERRLGAAVAAVAEAERLRGSGETAAEGRAVETDVIARVNAALARAGLPQETFRGQSPEADVALGGGAPSAGAARTRRQGVRISLAGLTAPRLGAFLAAWRDDNPTWVPVRVDLTRRRTGEGRGAAEGLYDAAVVVSTVYVELVPVPAGTASAGATAAPDEGS